MTSPDEPTRAVRSTPGPSRSTAPGVDATQTVSHAPTDATQASPGTGGPDGSGGGAGAGTGGPGGSGGSGGSDDEGRRRRVLLIGGIVVVVVGVLAGVGIALATQDDDSVSSSTTTTTSSSTSTSTSTSTSSSSTSSTTTTSTTSSTTTTSTTAPAPRIVSFFGPQAASCPAESVQLSWSTQNASGTTLSVDGGPASPGPASGTTNAAFDCDDASHQYTLATTGGSPTATQTVTVQNNNP
jgi:cytoskeletal protein RodZ